MTSIDKEAAIKLVQDQLERYLPGDLEAWERLQSTAIRAEISALGDYRAGWSGPVAPASR